MSAWTSPADVSDLELAFGGRDVIARLMPPMAEIPREFHEHRGKWQDVQSDWFFSGLTDVKWTPKPRVDGHKAVRHLKAIQSSFEPKHEHKAAAVAYLISLWFDDVTYTKKAAK